MNLEINGKIILDVYSVGKIPECILFTMLHSDICTLSTPPDLLISDFTAATCDPLIKHIEIFLSAHSMEASILQAEETVANMLGVPKL